MAYGTVDGSVGPKTGNWEARPGVDECVLIDVNGVLGTAEFFTGGYCRRAEEQGLLSPEGWGLEPPEDNGGGSGYGEGPPDGSNGIDRLFDGEKWGVRVRIWASGYRLGIWYGDKPADFYIYDFTNGNMVEAASRIIEYLKAATDLPSGDL